MPSQAALGLLFSAHENSIRSWIRERGAPARTASGYDLVEWIRWYGKHQVDLSGGGGVDDPDEYREKLRRAQLEYEQSKAKKMTAMAGRLEGSLVERARVETMLGTRATVFRADLERMARELAPKVVDFSDWRAIERAILDRIYGLLRTYVAPVPDDLTAVDVSELEDDDDSLDTNPPTPKPKKRARRKTRGKGKRRAQ